MSSQEWISELNHVLNSANHELVAPWWMQVGGTFTDKVLLPQFKTNFSCPVCVIFSSGN